MDSEKKVCLHYGMKNEIMKKEKLRDNKKMKS